MVERISPSACKVAFNSGAYEREALSAAALRATDKFHVKVEPCGTDSHAVIFQCKNECDDGLMENAALDLINDALDEQVRLDLARRTGAIRETIYQHAFTPFDLRDKKC